jgi:hypothetical protein
LNPTYFKAPSCPTANDTTDSRNVRAEHSMFALPSFNFREHPF